MFNRNVYPCHRVFHQLLERMLMAKRHSDGRGGERASSPCSSIMFSMASLIRLPRE